MVVVVVVVVRVVVVMVVVVVVVVVTTCGKYVFWVLDEEDEEGEEGRWSWGVEWRRMGDTTVLSPLGHSRLRYTVIPLWAAAHFNMSTSRNFGHPKKVTV